MQLGVARGRAAEVREGGEHAQRLLDRAGDERRVVEQHAALAGLLQQRPHRAAVRRLRAVVARRHQEEEAHDDLVLLEPLAVDLGVHEHARQVVGRALAALGDQRAAAREDLGHVRCMTASTPSGFRSGSSAPSVAFISRAHTASSSGGMPMKLPITRDTTGCATSVTRSHRLAAVEAVEHVARDRADLVLVLGDPLRREAALEERLEAVVLGRVHADEHRLLELERQDRVGERRDAADLRRVGLPVAADGVDVVGRGDRPVAGLVGVVGDALGPVHGAPRAQLLEELVRRPVLPQRRAR